jgi:glucose uptake protein GlcU
MFDGDLSLSIYIWGLIVYVIVLIEKLTFRDIFASFIAGLFWPISFPIRLLKAIFIKLEN